MPLLAGSPGSGMGEPVSGVTTDQRGVPVGSVIDIGACQHSVVVESTSRIGRYHGCGHDFARRG